jgi:hypothetical protein
MPLLVLFRGRPVKRVSRVGDRIRLIFFNPVLGQPGELTFVSVDEWRAGRSTRFRPGADMPDRRAMAAQFPLYPDLFKETLS